MVRVPDRSSPGSSSTCPNYPRPSGQLHRGQPAEDAGAHRAGMVLPAVLRDPARDHLQHRSRSTPSSAACSPCSARSRCCSSCPGSTPRRSARRSTARWYKLFFWIFVVDAHRARLARLAPGGRHLSAAGADRARSTTSRFFLIILPLLGLVRDAEGACRTRSPRRCLRSQGSMAHQLRAPAGRVIQPRETEP